MPNRQSVLSSKLFLYPDLYSVHLVEYFVCVLQAQASDDDEGLVHPGLQLKYSIHKNLAAMATAKDNYNAAMEHYLEVSIMLHLIILLFFLTNEIPAH